VYVVLVARVVATRDYWPRYDSGVFISGSVALHQGLGLRDITAPVGTPEQVWAVRPAMIEWSGRADAPDWPFFSQYPPLLPVLLVPFVWIGAGRYVALQLFTALCGGVGLLLMYRWREALFGAWWKAVLPLTTVSISTLYATRVQSEAVQLPLVLVVIFLVGRAASDPGRLAKSGMLAAIVLAAAVAVHTKVFFAGAGLAAWVLVASRAPWLTRLATTAAIGALAIVPAVAWNLLAAWRGMDGRASYSLLRNPYLWQNGWEPGTAFLGVDVRALVVWQERLVDALSRTVGGVLFPTVTTIIPNGPSSAASLPWVVGVTAILLLVGFARVASIRPLAPGAWAAVGYLAGTAVSPWFEPRTTVPLQPFLLLLLAAGGSEVLRRVGPLLRLDASLLHRAATVAVIAIAGLSWARFTPRVDAYAAQYYVGTPAQRAFFEASQRFPEQLTILVPGDNDAYALTTGRATVSTRPSEWKMSSAPRLVRAGGTAVEWSDTAPLHLWNKGTRVERLDLRHRTFTLPVRLVNAPPLPVRDEAAATPIAVGRIHPRWFTVTRAAAPSLWRATFPGSGR
jgi:hypothetical protein